MIRWEKNPGGKRYSATTPAGVYRLVRQNTAAGAAPWRATLEAGGTVRVVASVRYLAEAKSACEARDELEQARRRDVRRAEHGGSVELVTIAGVTYYGSPDCLFAGGEV